MMFIANHLSAIANHSISTPKENKNFLIHMRTHKKFLLKKYNPKISKEPAQNYYTLLTKRREINETSQKI